MRFACVYTMLAEMGGISRLESTRLHGKIRVRHASIHGKFCQSPAAVLLHSFEDSFRLEASSFKRGSRDMAALRVRCNSDCKASQYIHPHTHMPIWKGSTHKWFPERRRSNKVRRDH
jgi:hypothetical protein